MAHEAGKGSTPRPVSIPQKEFEERWDAIFKKPAKEEPVTDKDKLQEKQNNAGLV